MAEIRQLRKAPVVEALLDFRFNVPEGIGAKEVQELAEQFAIEFPTREVRRTFKATFSIGEDADENTAASKPVEGFVLRSEDRKKAIILKRNGLTVSQVKSYSDWDALAADAKSAFERFCHQMRPQGVSRVGVRFINRLALPFGIVDLDSLLTRAPQTPVGTPELLNLYHCQLGIVDEVSGIKAILNQGILEPGIKEGRSILIDSDVYSTGSFDANFDSLRPILGSLRDMKNKIFFGSLTEEALEPYL